MRGTWEFSAMGFQLLVGLKLLQEMRMDRRGHGEKHGPVLTAAGVKAALGVKSGTFSTAGSMPGNTGIL